MNTTYISLNSIINQFEIKYYNNLIKYSKKYNIDYYIFNNILKNLNDEKIELSITETEVIKDIEFSDDYLYKKQWTKLSNIHKIIKIKEFVSKLLIDNESNKETLKDNLVQLIHNKYLTKKDKVKYDMVNGRIIAIPVLNFKDGKYFVET